MKNKLLTGIPALVAVVTFLFILSRSVEPPVDPSNGHTDPSVEGAITSSFAGQESVPSNEGDVGEAGRELISANLDVDAVWESKYPAAFRCRAVTPAAALLAKEPVFREGDRLTLPLFDDAVLDAVIRDVTSYPNGAVGMTARLQGKYSGTVYLSSCGGELRIHADVLGGNGYYVRYDPEQRTHIAIEIDRENSDNQEDCAACAGELDTPVAAQVDAAVPEDVVEVPAPPVAASDGTNDSVVVDVMVVYTPAALAVEGSTNAINNNIVLAMQKANTAHGNSDTKVTLNLVYSGEISYTESGDAGADLDALTFTGAPYSEMDDVQTLRDIYSADMVCLLEDLSGTGGLGWILSNENGRPDYAFCLARVQQSSWTYTVVHEWGHNMGCGHSATQYTQQGPGLYSYSSGWQWDDSASPYDGYCTVMTYENFDGAGGYEYIRIPNFSNPAINYTGAGTNPTGDAAAGDNARSIRNVRFVVGDYRISSTPVTAYPCSNSFENAYSPWRYYGADIEWDRDSGGTPSSGTGPSTGYDGAYYVYVEASGNNNMTANLQASFDFSALGAPQISYAYHMYGADMGTLTLEASINGGSSWSPLWTMSGNQGDAWYTNSLSLSAYAGNAETLLRFRGITGSGYASDMALDAIVVSEAVDSSDIDGDGMPNDWETLYFGGPTNAVAGENPDNDFYSNIEEYVAGLNPTNSDSFGPSTLMSSGSNMWFSWTPVTGRVYSVYWTSNLLNGFSLLQSNLTSGVYTDTVHSAEQQGFYRMGVELAP